MNKEQTISECAAMTDEELVRALTLDKENYAAEFLGLLAQERANRKLDLAEFVNKVRVRLNNDAEGTCTIDQAVAKLTEEISLWDAWKFTNSVNETLLLQKEVSFWTIHLFDDEEYQQSFLVKTSAEARDFLARFLRLEDEGYTVEYQYNLLACETLAKSNSQRYIQRISAALAEAAIPHTVRNTSFVYNDVILGTRLSEELFHLLVPAEDIDSANAVAEKVVEAVERNIQNLYGAIAELSEGRDQNKLLECYNQLVQLVDDDPAVYYNRGVLLFELGRFEEAAEPFLDAVNIGWLADASDEEVYEFESCLQRIMKETSQKLPLLHTLASIAQLKKDDVKAEELYSKIISLDPSDSIAHLNLGYLYYQDPLRNDRAAKHFKAYLELRPEAEDREAIESILAEL